MSPGLSHLSPQSGEGGDGGTTIDGSHELCSRLRCGPQFPHIQNERGGVNRCQELSLVLNAKML